MDNENEEIENCFTCQYCSLSFDDSEERDNHVLQTHYKEVEESLNRIRNVASENAETIESWKDSKKKELLLKIASQRPALLHIIQCSPHSDEMLNKEIEMDLLRRALRTNTLSSFDAMWIQHPRFEEIYRASREKPEHQPQSGDSTGQDEQFFESPDAMIDTTKRTNVRENLSEEDMKKKQLVLILYSLLRKRKQ